MRASTLAILLFLQVTAGPSWGSTNRTQVGYLPSPAATSAGRSAVISQLKRIGREESQAAREMAEAGCEDYNFHAEVLFDTPIFYSLKTAVTWTCYGRSTQGGTAPLLFEMRTGRKYDISRLYRVRDAQGALIAPLRAIVLSRLRQADISHQEAAAAVEDDLGKGKPQLFVTKKGILIWTETGLSWVDDDVVLTWADLQPYLDAAEATRISWTSR